MPQDGHQRPDHPGHPVAHQDGGVDRDGPGRRLGDGGQIQHFLLLDPVQIVHEFFLHQGNDDEPPPEGEALR